MSLTEQLRNIYQKKKKAYSTKYLFITSPHQTNIHVKKITDKGQGPLTKAKGQLTHCTEFFKLVTIERMDR